MYIIQLVTKVQIGSALALVGEGTADLSGLGCGELLKVIALPSYTGFDLKDKANKSYGRISRRKYQTQNGGRFRFAYKNEAKLFS